MTTKTSRMTHRMLLAALASAACNGSQDFCTHSVAVSQKLENELSVCALDAGLPASTDTTTELDKCRQQLTGCDAQDQTALNTAADCIDELPPLQCAWFTSDGGIPLSALAWALEAYSCEPTSLSASCQIVPGLSLDAGLPF
jgi:hypothetical protein